MFEVYSPEPVSGSLLNTQRAVSAANDGGRWRFDANGEPFEFENFQQYHMPRIRDRFTPEMLDEYLRNFGIHLFSPDFYETEQPTYLISKEGPCAAQLREYTLEEARATH